MAGPSVILFIAEEIKNVPEIDLCHVLLEWSQQEVLRRLDIQDPDATLDVFDMFVPFIRFLAMTGAEFARGPGKWGLFNDRQKLAILNSILDPDGPLPNDFPPHVCRIRNNRYSHDDEM
ncbi:hypothetical protein HPB48_015064 [Haemaphysalis longicornis]|uniref:Uncharacterized protein n=1 Tax=Haemaphysalis longicornis TaxID=44386 RepID=A0A9J6GL41_HAELO|nr:hypothetical protein HPB48_015064 [Haemaphysalis longicornis]